MTLSDLYTRITNLARTSGTALRATRKQVGKLTDLTTNDKTSIVNAINELNAKFSSNSSGSEKLEAPLADVLNTLDERRLEAVLKYVEQQIDSDEDGVNDYDERYEYKTDPYKADTDEDGYSDYDEINGYNTDPNDRESVPDFTVNGFEVVYNDYSSNEMGIVPTKDGSRFYTRPSNIKVAAFILTSSGGEDPLVVSESHGLISTGYTVRFEGYSILSGFRFFVRVEQEGYSETKTFVAIKGPFDGGYTILEENINFPDITQKIARAFRDSYRLETEYDHSTDSTNNKVRMIPLTYEIPFLSDNFEFIVRKGDGSSIPLKTSGESVVVGQSYNYFDTYVLVRNKVTGEEVRSGNPQV